MALYEVMLVINPELEPEEQKSLVEDFKGTLVKLNSKVDRIVDWHLRKLAYEINKLSEGHYYLIYFSGDSSIIPELEHYFRVNDNIIRYMVISLDEKNYELAVNAAPVEAVDSLETTETGTAVEAEKDEPVISPDANDNSVHHEDKAEGQLAEGEPNQSKNEVEHEEQPETDENQ